VFGDKTGDGVAPPLFGSNVSKIKEMFQTNAPVVKSDLHHQAPEVEKSPESKRKKTV
jgi:hypothetical protein